MALTLTCSDYITSSSQFDGARILELFSISGVKYVIVSANTDSEVTIAKINNPTDISFVSSLTGSGSPNYLNNVRGLDVFSTGGSTYCVALGTSDNSIVTIDISDPSSPSKSGHLIINGSPYYCQSPENVFVQEIGGTHYAFVAGTAEDALGIFDVSTPSSISHTSSITGGGSPNYLNFAYNVFVAQISSSWYAFVTSKVDNALTIIDVSTPGSPSHAGVISGSGSPNYLYQPNAVFVQEISGTAYAFTVAAGSDDALSVFDVSTPSSPSLVDVIRGSGSPNYLDNPYWVDILEVDSTFYAFVACYGDRLTVIDVTDPSSMSFDSTIADSASSPLGGSYCSKAQIYTAYNDLAFVVSSASKDDSISVIQTGSLTSYWTQETSATVAKDNSVYHSHDQSLKVTAGADNVGATQTVTGLISDTYYVLNAWVLVTAGDTARIYIKSGGIDLISITGINNSSYWEPRTLIFKTDATSIDLYLRAGSNGDIVWFDDVQLYRLSDIDSTLAMGGAITNTFRPTYNDLGLYIASGVDVLYKEVPGNPQAASFLARIYPQFDPTVTVGDDRYVFKYYADADNNNYLLVYWDTSDSDWVVEWSPVVVSIDFAETYAAQAANGTIHDITTEDVGISAWIKMDNGGNDSWIFSKNSGVNTGVIIRVVSSKIEARIGDGSDTYVLTGNTNVNDGEWHHIAAIFDRDSEDNCKIYLDGSEDGTTNKSGTLADVDSITNSNKISIGCNASAGNEFDGKIRDVILAYPSDIVAEGEMGSYGMIEKIYNNALDPDTYPNNEDYWLCNDGSGTTVTGANNDLTLSNAAAWDSSAEAATMRTQVAQVFPSSGKYIELSGWIDVKGRDIDGTTYYGKFFVNGIEVDSITTRIEIMDNAPDELVPGSNDGSSNFIDSIFEELGIFFEALEDDELIKFFAQRETVYNINGAFSVNYTLGSDDILTYNSASGESRIYDSGLGDTIHGGSYVSGRSPTLRGSKDEEVTLYFPSAIGKMSIIYRPHWP